MKILVNGQEKELEKPISLSELLERFELPVERIAVEVNEEVISRANWSKVLIKEGDKIEIVHFVGGG
ncbi:MAG: sulfur carrier protein ThiS [Pyrinomonadaceae bacterium]|nr:sulfur carrier protein ThiS [Pyrinomonadaceae bacterium]MCX7639083.1 sulfur carrier protein ThiS [Pyrinomonadaceae bacterium]MDW8303696.1 sulfur carrier protein ThiS [Acidobacteriota bacterium]